MMSQQWYERLKYPIDDPFYRVRIVNEANKCPECAEDLDTGWECSECGYDARSIAYPQGRSDK